MALALFDLDNTLINGDSDYAWGEYLTEQKMVDPVDFKIKNEAFYRDYQAGTLDIHAYQAFIIQPITHLPVAQLSAMRNDFLNQKVKPMALEKAQRLIDNHKKKNHTLMIITATNRFVTEPIAEWLGIENLLATELEKIEGYYTGRIIGAPCFQQGKVTRLEQWLSKNTTNSLQDSYFYSDSANDIPLLEKVAHPIAVDADSRLTEHATAMGWDKIS